ncbi:MAG: HEAT repeat domain-containing protein [Anaerolineae bacterium]|nr:HEAT repeat domain-containing protein [Anaerolineae bacterium]
MDSLILHTPGIDDNVSRASIAEMRAAHDWRGLVRALKDEDPDIRALAAFALGVLGEPRAVFALEQSLLGEEDESAQTHMHAALIHLRRLARQDNAIAPDNVNHLIEKLKSKDTREIVAAANSLARLKDKSSVVPLFILFRDGGADHRARLAAAEALMALDSAPAIVTLLGALRSPDWQVRRNAAAMLGMVKAEWAITPLMAALDDPHEAVQRTAETALLAINSPEALAALEAHRRAFRGDERDE